MTRRFKRTLADAVAAAAFLALICLPLGARLAGVEPAETENRSMVEQPPVELDEALKTDYVDQVWGPYLKDQLPLRDWALHLKALISLRIFGESPNPSVILGKDGFLFYEQELDRGCASAFASAEQIARNVRAWADYFEGKGGRMVIALVPDKAMVYRDKIRADQLDRYSCVDRKNQRVRAGLAEIESLALIDLYPALKAAAEGSEEFVYYPTDSHWKWHHSLMLVERIVERLKPGLYDRAEIEEHHDRAQTDLALMVGLKHIRPISFYDADRPDIETTIDAPSSAIARRATSTGDAERLIDGPAAMVSDSFFNKSLPALEPYFSEINHIDPTEVRSPAGASIVSGSRYLVIQAVMRNIYEMFSLNLTEERIREIANAPGT